MTPIQKAQQDWENNTTLHLKKHLISRFRPVFQIQEFRQFGNAIAMLNWSGDCIEITKFETLRPNEGAATRLIEFLKSLADKYQVRLWGHARPYEPDSPPTGHLLTKEELEEFYKKHGFQLRKIDAETSDMLYVPTLNVRVA
jgi:hypothetical protein